MASKLLMTIFVLVLLLAVAWLDYITGYDVPVQLFYLLPVTLAAWYLSTTAGVLLAVAAALAWTAADVLSGHVYETFSLLAWSSAIQLGIFLFAALASSRIAADLRKRTRLNAELSAEKARIESLNSTMTRDLEMARLVQQAMISPSPSNLPGLDVAIEYRPAIQVGGDVLNVYPVDPNRTIFFLGDAMGHGVRAALVMSAANAVARTTIYAQPHPALLLNTLNSVIYGSCQECFITGVCCLIDTSTHTATIASAGHHNPFWLRPPDPGIQEPGSVGLPLGVNPDTHYDETVINWTPGNILVFFTDGLVEAHNPANERYGYNRLRVHLRAAAHLSAQEITDSLILHLLDHCSGEPIHDDVALLVIRTLPPNIDSPSI